MSRCIRCDSQFEGRYPKSKICRSCSKRGQPRGKRHWNFKDGSYTYETLRREIKERIGSCERCSADLTDATRYEWCVHHKDHDHYNNDPSNLELLCKRCHQIEHECWRAFEGATTIPSGSTASRDSSEAPDT